MMILLALVVWMIFFPGIFLLGLLALAYGATGDTGGGCDGSCNRSGNDDFYNDDYLMPSTRVFREIRPFFYNPYTGGWTAEEDAENGW